MCPSKINRLVSFRKHLTADFLMETNEYILEVANAQMSIRKNESRSAKVVNTLSGDIENLGTKILNVTCSPSNIRYPQDFLLHKPFYPWGKPRTYWRVARKKYLALAKSKKWTEKKIRATICKQLGCERRDLEYLEHYMEGEGYVLQGKYINNYLVIQKFYEQQKYMYDNKTHSA